MWKIDYNNPICHYYMNIFLVWSVCLEEKRVELGISMSECVLFQKLKIVADRNMHSVAVLESKVWWILKFWRKRWNDKRNNNMAREIVNVRPCLFGSWIHMRHCVFSKLCASDHSRSRIFAGVDTNTTTAFLLDPHPSHVLLSYW